MTYSTANTNYSDKSHISTYWQKCTSADKTTLWANKHNFWKQHLTNANIHKPDHQQCYHSTIFYCRTHFLMIHTGEQVSVMLHSQLCHLVLGTVKIQNLLSSPRLLLYWFIWYCKWNWVKISFFHLCLNYNEIWAVYCFAFFSLKTKFCLEIQFCLIKTVLFYLVKLTHEDFSEHSHLCISILHLLPPTMR